jgi:aldehyde dehydrogenase (NAD+)
VNHILVDPSVRDELVQSLKKYFNVFMDGRERPEYYTKIVNDRNFVRLEKLLQDTSGEVVYGGDRDRATRYFAPTIVVNVRPGDSLLSEELFGPMLPIVDADLDTAISYTRAGEHPLAIYAFTQDPTERERVLHETQSGGVTFNDCMLHIAAHNAPFGGVGNSGQGYYHGKYGVLAFSHLRTYISGLPSWMEGLMAARYPPYTEAKTKTIAPAMKASFDRDGNEISSMGGLIVKVFGVAVIAAAMKMTLWGTVVRILTPMGQS